VFAQQRCVCCHLDMDFEPAPAGVVGAALLAHRGADHEVVVPAASPFHGCMQNAFDFTPGVAGAHNLPYSDTSAVGAYICFTRDPAVLQHLVGHAVISPTKYQTAWTYAFTNGFDANTLCADVDHAHARADAWLSTVNTAAVPADLLVTAADLHLTDPTVPAAAGGAAALWRRSALIAGFACEVDGVGVPGLYSLKAPG
jgi:hypothetical protein